MSWVSGGVYRAEIEAAISGKYIYDITFVLEGVRDDEFVPVRNIMLAENLVSVCVVSAWGCLVT
jgi:hypothetical protein